METSEIKGCSISPKSSITCTIIIIKRDDYVVSINMVLFGKWRVVNVSLCYLFLKRVF